MAATNRDEINGDMIVPRTLSQLVQHDVNQIREDNEDRVITPVTSEVEWLAYLDHTPVWQPPLGPILLICPHPDDETLGAGGLIRLQRNIGFPVTIAAVTNGENAYADAAGGTLGEIRKSEQINALACLGVGPESIVRFHLTDSDVGSNEDKLINLLLPLATDGSHIVAPWSGDFHPDHEACGRAAAEVARLTGATLTSYIFWSWHRGTPEIFRDLSLQRFPLTPEMMLAKAAALQCHRSQLKHPSGEPVLPNALLWPAILPFEVFIPS